MATVVKRKLSGSTDGKPINVLTISGFVNSITD